MSLIPNKNEINRDSSEFYFFLAWLVDDYRQDVDCEYCMTEEEITDRVLDIIQSPHKYIKEMQKFKNLRKF
tara:strand:+ start:11745 stop:11957 length:213 start_codon:yes stop_codon:yes gene_type:complete